MEYDPLVQISQELAPPDREYWAPEQEYGALPYFTTKQVAVIFFARGKMWLMHLMWGTDRRIDAVPIDVPRISQNHRQFQLRHVELLAHHLFRYGIIDFRTFSNAIMIIKAMASNYRLI